MRPSVTSAAILLLAACSDSGRLYFDYPELGAHPAMVLAFESASGLQLAAIDLTAGEPTVHLPNVISPDEEWEAHALLLNDDLPTLKLQAGPLEPSPVGESYPILLEADRVYERRSSAGEEAGWVLTESIPPELSPLRVKNDDPFGFCPEIDVKSIEFPGARGNLRFLAGKNTTEAFALVVVPIEISGTEEEQRFFIVREVGAETVVEELEMLQGLALRAATFDPDGALWVAALGGQLLRAEIGLTQVDFVPVGRAPVPASLEPNWLHVGQDEIVMMGVDGDVHVGARSSTLGVAWREGLVHEFPNELDVGRGSGALLEVSNGEIWLAKGTTRHLVKLRHTAGVFAEKLIDARLEGEPALGLSALSEIDGLGILVGMTDGQVSSYDPNTDTWRSLGPSQFTQVASCILPTADGFFMTGGTGLFNFYVTSKGYCPLDARGYKGQRAPNTIRYMRAFGDGYLLGGTAAFGSIASVTLIKRKS